MATNEKVHAIADLAERFGLSQRALRFYEIKGLIDPVQKVSGWRCYTNRHVAQIEGIMRMKRCGFSLVEIKHAAARSKSGVPEPTEKEIEQRIKQLEKEREIVNERLSTLLRQYPVPTSDSSTEVLAN